MINVSAPLAASLCALLELRATRYARRRVGLSLIVKGKEQRAKEPCALRYEIPNAKPNN